MSNSPLVSVIVPAYNAETFIRETLDSVLAQTYTNIEVLVVDDGSHDQTAEIVKSFVQKDQRVTLLQQTNAGVAAARNLAIQKSMGEYIAPIDADDIWHPQKLEKQVRCILEAEPSVGLIYTWSLLIDEGGFLYPEHHSANVKEGEVYLDLLSGNFISNASVPLICRDCFERVGYYNCQFKEYDAQGLEDWDLYLRISECYQFRVVPEFLVGYRQVIGSMSFDTKSMEKSFYLMIADARQRHPEIPTNIYQQATSKYYFYLGWKSKQSGNNWSRLYWLYKAFKANFAIGLKPSFYKALGKTILAIISKPITFLIWQDYHSWLRFKQQLRSNYSFPSTLFGKVIR